MLKRFALLLVLVVVAASAARADGQRITFLHINDVYEILPRDGVGGFAELQTLVRKERAAATNSLFTFGGDLLSPSLLSGMTRGAHMVELLNVLGVDVAVPGNHEFDFGAENFISQAKASRFPWLGDNLADAQGQPLGGTVRGWIHTLPAPGTGAGPFGPVRIGFIGLITPETETSSKPGPGVAFLPVIGRAKAAAAALQAAGVDMIVALTHLAVAEDRQLAAAVPAIDLILGGHDHDAMIVHEGPTLIVKATADAYHLAAVEMEIDRTTATDGRKRVSLRPLAMRQTSTRGVAPDPEAGAVVARWQGQLDAAQNRPLLTLPIDLDSRKELVRSRESSMADVIADAMRNATGADVALINGGGIRGNRLYSAGSAVTMADILRELPFGDVTLLAELKGTDLLEALENGLSRVEAGAGRFLQVSGLRLEWEPGKPAGQRVAEVTIAGRPLEADKAYRVALFDYLYNGSDGFTSLRRGKLVVDASAATLTATQVIDYLSGHGGALAVGDRIIRK